MCVPARTAMPAWRVISVGDYVCAGKDGYAGMAGYISDITGMSNYSLMRHHIPSLSNPDV